MMNAVYLVTHGDGSDDSACGVEAVFTTEELAKQYIRDYNSHRPSWAHLRDEGIECHALDVEFNPADYPNDREMSDMTAKDM